MHQVFQNNPKVEICMLDDFTSSASETIYLTLTKMNVNGSFVIKDSDNRVGVNFDGDIKNMIVGYDLHQHRDVTNVPGKSFLIINEQNIIQDIIEKQIVSNIVCLGVYCFESADDFKHAYEEMQSRKISGEMYISHVISYMLSQTSIFLLLLWRLLMTIGEHLMNGKLFKRLVVHILLM